MFEQYITVFLLSHILGDYYLQTDAMAQKKQSSIKVLLFHCMLYWLGAVIVIIPIFTIDLFHIILLLGLTHMIIDVVKYVYLISKKRKLHSEETRLIYVTDQLAHFMCIIFISYLAARGEPIKIMPIANDFFDITGIPKLLSLKYILISLMMHKPANITIKQLLLMYKPTMDNQDSHTIVFTDKRNTGAYIGTMERLIILLLLAVNQFSAIGFVLTAKSIARYDQIARDKNFAEYYLLGTLMSTALVISVHILLI